MRSLTVRLLGAFVLVIVITLAVVSWASNQATTNAYRQFRGRDAVVQQELVVSLADLYARAGSWDGAAALLQAAAQDGRGRGRGAGAAREALPMRLVDAQSGRVVADVAGQTVGTIVTSDELAGAQPIVVAGETVGYLLVDLEAVPLTTGEQSFLDQVRDGIWLSGLVAAGAALLLVTLLTVSILRPIRRMQAAAEAVARGDLQTRVSVPAVDELAALASSFNQMATSLQQLEQARQNLTADVTHELRTPLTVMQGNLQAMLDGVYPLDRDEIRTLYDETLLMSHVVEDLQVLSRSEAGQLEIACEPVSVAGALQRAASAYEQTATERRLDLRIELPAMPLPAVLADPTRLDQVLHNLLSNAIRYTPRGGRIVLTATPEAGGVRTSVQDTGQGIKPEDLPHVFDRFWRADRSRARVSGGSGLGLAIVRSLVRAQGGEVGVTSQPGQGTTFWFVLPVAEDISGTH